MKISQISEWPKASTSLFTATFIVHVSSASLNNAALRKSAAHVAHSRTRLKCSDPVLLHKQLKSLEYLTGPAQLFLSHL